MQVAALTTAAEVWEALSAMHSLQSRAQVMRLRMQLATITKHDQRVAEYFTRMQSLEDAMTAAGSKMQDDDLASYILAGLNVEWNPLVTAMTTRLTRYPHLNFMLTSSTSRAGSIFRTEEDLLATPLPSTSTGVVVLLATEEAHHL
jgi:hypothetical protein